MKNKKYVLIILISLVFLVLLITGIVFIRKHTQTKERSTSELPNESAVDFVQIAASYTSTPPIFDGVLGAEGEDWGKAVATKTLSYTNSLTGESETHEMNVYARYDDNNLYIAVTVENDEFFTDKEYERNSRLWIYFDGNNNGIIEENEDAQRFPWDLMHGDFHLTADGSRVQDEQSDGGGRWRFETVSGNLGNATYEFEIPLNSGDPQDLSITPGSTVGIKIEYEEMHYSEKTGTFDTVGGDTWPRGHRLDGLTYAKLTLEKN